mmetsp:Transcript_35656/g.112053  ORF Transcript_35656/g.112053 Transcript_35656/m.112053 type:complete len:265 (+) Transcript_35656:1076-1870(+)
MRRPRRGHVALHLRRRQRLPARSHRPLAAEPRAAPVPELHDIDVPRSRDEPAEPRRLVGAARGRRRAGRAQRHAVPRGAVRRLQRRLGLQRHRLPRLPERRGPRGQLRRRPDAGQAPEHLPQALEPVVGWLSHLLAPRVSQAHLQRAAGAHVPRRDVGDGVGPAAAGVRVLGPPHREGREPRAVGHRRRRRRHRRGGSFRQRGAGLARRRQQRGERRGRGGEVLPATATIKTGRWARRPERKRIHWKDCFAGGGRGVAGGVAPL